MAKTSGGVRGNRPKNVTQQAKEQIMTALADIKRQGFSRITPFKIGSVEKRMADFARRNGIEFGSRDVYMSPSAIAHATRESKRAKGLSVSDEDLTAFPGRRRKMDLYHDTRTGNFTYTDGKTKYVVHPNYEIKMPGGKRKLVNFITASRIESKQEFIMSKYTKI